LKRRSDYVNCNRKTGPQVTFRKASPRSSTITRRGRNDGQEAGEVLREEFLVALKMSAVALGRVCDLPLTRIERIASEQTGIAADTALRLGNALATTAQLWLNLPTDNEAQAKARSRQDSRNKPKAA